MSQNTILILQDNINTIEEIKLAISNSQGLEVIGYTDSGCTAKKLINANNPDIIILDLILKDEDGFAVLDYLNQSQHQCKIIVYSSFNREEIINSCIEKGALYYLTKSCSATALIQRVTELTTNTTLQPTVLATPKPQQIRTLTPSLDEKISKIFISVGIPPHIKGYSYLREGVKMATRDPDIINNITKKLYPMIGEIYKTTASKVERAIRHAIEVAWNKGRVETINSLFGVRAYIASEKPTNGEFIALIADKMLLEGA